MSRFRVESFSPAELALLKAQCERDFSTFCTVFFLASTGRHWIESPPQKIIVETLEKVVRGEILQLIINIPPRYGKTWLVCVLWVAWNLANYPWSRFLYTSYSDDLVLKSSRFVRDIIQTPLYQLFWPCSFRNDETAKKAWELQESGGGLNAASVGGQLTGFGAGVTGFENVFSGAQIIDDPNKVQDSGSLLECHKVKLFYTETFESRKEHRKVPCVVIQQRTCPDDLSGYLLTEGVHGFWHHLAIPALVEESDEYPDEYKFGIPIAHRLPVGPLWEAKHSRAELEAMRDNPLSEFKFWSQYQQVPRIRGGGMVKRHWFVDYKSYDPKNGTVDGIRIAQKKIFADTAFETKEHNDRSVFLCAAKLSDGRVAVLDMWTGRVEAPDLLEAAKNFVYKHVFVENATNVGLSDFRIEKKASGHGLIQTLRRDLEFMRRSRGLTITPIERNIDKVSRMNATAPHIKVGALLVPENALWREELVSEVAGFSPFGTAKHDDITDTIMDAIHDFRISEEGLNYGVYK